MLASASRMRAIAHEAFEGSLMMKAGADDDEGEEASARADLATIWDKRFYIFKIRE